MPFAIVLVAVLGFAASPTGGQQGGVPWSVDWGGGDRQAGHRLILGNPISIPVTISVANDGNELAFIGEPAGAVNFVVREGPAMSDLVVSCQSLRLSRRDGPSGVVPVGAVVLSPGDSATFSCALSRVDGAAFVSGRSAVDVLVDWPGVRQRGLWQIEVRPPETASEMTRFYVLAGSMAMAAEPRDVSAAILHFRAAVAASPDDFRPLSSLAGAYDAAGRRAESIAARELALQKPGARDSRLPELLARAFLLEGDVASARRVLRQAGRSEADIDAFTRGSAARRK